MKYIFHFFLLSSLSLFSQESIEAPFIKTIELNDEVIISIDNFGTAYYLKNNALYTKNIPSNITYNNFQLGELSSVNTFSPLKINLFYKDFNTAIILDNRLAEIYKIDFNAINTYINVTHISTGHDNTLWVFNQDLQRLELFDYKSKTSKAQTVPVQSEVLDLKSDFNYCWLLTKKTLYKYNYFGRLISKMDNTGFTSLVQNNENLILKKENSLFYLNKTMETIQPIKTPNLIINAFFVTNETLYIYNNETLQQFQLKIN